MFRRKGFIRLRLEGRLKESASGGGLWRREPEVDLFRAAWVLRRAAREERIRSLLLEVGHLRLGPAQATVLREGLREFRERGGKCHVFLERPSTLSYLVATAADSITLPPAASLPLTGLGVEVLFWKQLLEDLGVEAQLFQSSPHKTAAEPFLRSSMSPEHREMLEELLEKLHQWVISSVASSRGVEEERVHNWISQAPFSAQEALQLGLVDRLLYPDELLEEFRQSGLREFPLRKLASWEGSWSRWTRPWRPQIAYLVLEGRIPGSGHREPGSMPSRALLEQIRLIRRRRRIRGVVLRINSPGGDALTADLLWHELDRLAREKPLVVSLSDVAASGGYYLALAGKPIIAAETTLTGSIGVISGKFQMWPLLRRLGIRPERVLKGPQALIYSPFRPFSPEEAGRVEALVRAVYETFLTRVAQRWQRSPDEVRPWADGRILTGAQAREKGLVDQVGNLWKAFDEVCEQAGISPRREVRILRFPLRPRLLQWLSRLVGGPRGELV